MAVEDLAAREPVRSEVVEDKQAGARKQGTIGVEYQAQHQDNEVAELAPKEASVYEGRGAVLEQPQLYVSQPGH